LWRQWVPASGKIANKNSKKPAQKTARNCRVCGRAFSEQCRARRIGSHWAPASAGGEAFSSEVDTGSREENASKKDTLAKELSMRNRILAIAAIAGAISVPIAAQAQSDTVGVVRGGSVIINDDQGIAVDQRPAFREYIIRERVPNYTIPDRVIVGGVLPETGVTYYDVPQTYAVTPYRYTVVNGQTVLVEPRTRRIVQVVE
jgi:hypothetical protein